MQIGKNSKWVFMDGRGALDIAGANNDVYIIRDVYSKKKKMGPNAVYKFRKKKTWDYMKGESSKQIICMNNNLYTIKDVKNKAGKKIKNQIHKWEDKKWKSLGSSNIIALNTTR